MSKKPPEAVEWEVWSTMASLIRFCFPDGKWRGEANMEGLMPYVVALRYYVQKYDPDSLEPPPKGNE